MKIEAIGNIKALAAKVPQALCSGRSDLLIKSKDCFASHPILVVQTLA
jgi:hypothetical protein